MKKILIFFLILISSYSHAAEEGCSKVYSALVFDEESQKILTQTRFDEIAYPASLVKMMTLYLTFEALENGHLHADQLLKISEAGEEISKVNKNNTMRLKRGDQITVRQAIDGVIVKSFNEASITLAEAVAGDEWEFVRKMNEKAKELGMINTSFRNSTGLHEEGQYTTSQDLARLATAIKKDFPGYYHLFSQKEFSYRGTKFETHNHVLVDYKGAEGMKTGFTKASGFNLITSAKKDDRRLISVVMGCATFQSRDKLTKEMLNEAFKKISTNEKNLLAIKIGKKFDYKNSQPNDDYEEEMHFGMLERR